MMINKYINKNRLKCSIIRMNVYKVVKFLKHIDSDILYTYFEIIVFHFCIIMKSSVFFQSFHVHHGDSDTFKLYCSF